MTKTFNEVWERIQKEIRPGQIIQNWGKARGSRGGNFKIIEVNSLTVICDPPKAKHNQPVPKEDFQAVWQIWPDYLIDKILRYQIRDITRYSVYIVSIFHFLDLH